MIKKIRKAKVPELYDTNKWMIKKNGEGSVHGKFT